MKIKFGIIGSNTSAQAVRRLNRNLINIAPYAPKISIGTAFHAQKTSLDESLLIHDSFRRQVINRDAHKTLNQELNESSPDILVIDFHSEIFDFIKNTNNEILTNSDYLPKCIKDDPKASWEVIDRDSEESWTLWAKGLNALAPHLAGRRLFLLTSYLPTSYASAGEILEYSAEKQKKISHHNSIIEKCNNYFLKNFDCEIIRIPTHLNHSIVEEKIGLSLNTLSENAYFEVAQQIASALENPELFQYPPTKRIEKLLSLFGPILESGDIPNITELHQIGNEFLINGDTARAQQTERLIALLRNSSVPLSAKLGKVMFGYGGIGVIVHAQCKIGDYVTIGGNVTIGGGKSSIQPDGKTRNVPHIEDRVYIATGAKILGGITVGHHSVIGANAVCVKDVPPYSVVAGNPAKIIKTITTSNFTEYSSYLYKGMPATEVKHRMFCNNE